MYALFKNYLPAPLLTLTILLTSITGPLCASAKRVSDGETWLARPELTMKWKTSHRKAKGAEEEACMALCSERLPDYLFFHRYVRNVESCFCDGIANHHTISYIGIPKEHGMPIYLIKAKRNRKGSLILEQTTTGPEMSISWTVGELAALEITLTDELATETKSPKKSGTLAHSLRASLAALEHIRTASEPIIRLVTVYNPTTGSVDTYTPVNTTETDA